MNQREAYQKTIAIIASHGQPTPLEAELAKENPILFVKLYEKLHPEVKEMEISEPAWLITARKLYGEGKKIEAIKEVRTATNMGLKEAKDYVEAGFPRPIPPTYSPTPALGHP